MRRRHQPASGSSTMIRPATPAPALRRAMERACSACDAQGRSPMAYAEIEAPPARWCRCALARAPRRAPRCDKRLFQILGRRICSRAGRKEMRETGKIPRNKHGTAGTRPSAGPHRGRIPGGASQKRQPQSLRARAFVPARQAADAGRPADVGKWLLKGDETREPQQAGQYADISDEARVFAQCGAQKATIRCRNCVCRLPIRALRQSPLRIHARGARRAYPATPSSRSDQPATSQGFGSASRRCRTATFARHRIGDIGREFDLRWRKAADAPPRPAPSWRCGASEVERARAQAARSNAAIRPRATSST